MCVSVSTRETYVPGDIRATVALTRHLMRYPRAETKRVQGRKP